MTEQLLAVYLQDHFAGAVGAAELLARMERANHDTDFAQPITSLRAEFKRERQTLETIMTRLQIDRSTLKEGGSWLAEKLGRLKLNKSLTDYSPLSRVEELEALIAGVTGKRALWQALGETLSGTADVDFEAMIERANDQLETLRALHQRAVTLAFKSAS